MSKAGRPAGADASMLRPALRMQVLKAGGSIDSTGGR